MFAEEAPISPKEILVTGAAGFVGSHVVEALATRGDRVIGIDNLNDYYDPARKRANLQEVSSWVGARFTFIEADIRDRYRVADLFREHNFHAVVHLAAMAGVRASIENPDLYFNVNVDGTRVLLDEVAQRGEGAANFVLASTSSVYGKTDRIPFVESDPCDRPLVPYSASKRAAEMIGYSYQYLYGIDCTVLRLFTVYGPRGRPDMMAFKVADSLRKGVDVPLYNGGQMYRDWTYVGDIVSGIVAAVDRRLGYEIINLGRGEPVLLADFVELVEERLGGSARLHPEPMPQGDVQRTYADVGKARKLLDYESTVSVEEGVARFLEWYAAAT
jgi:UDP-glucuronate 4-epimerase